METALETGIEEELRKLLDDAYISDSQKPITKTSMHDDFDRAARTIGNDDDDDDDDDDNGQPTDE